MAETTTTETIPAVRDPRVDAAIDDDFAGVVLVRRGGEVTHASAHGLASRRWGVPMTLGTRFDIASITKLFTSVAVLQLVDEARLDLDASIHEYADLDGTTISRQVTLRHLLTHTSGIADDADEEAGEDYADLFVDSPNYAITETAHFLKNFADKPALAAPGEQCRYCNAGYVLAGLAIESATGRPYRDHVVEAVFGRAGMTRSGFFDRRDAEPEVAEGGEIVDGRWQQNIYSYPPIGSPDGGAHATASDLLRFLDAVRGGELLSAETTRLFLTPQVEHDDDVSYGFGLEFSGTTMYKDGINAGSSGLLIAYADDVDAVVLSTSEDGAWPVVSALNELYDA